MKQLLKGNEAVGAAALIAGIDTYFAYPITPQNEISEYMAREMPLAGKAFLQAESEVAAINMVYGAAAAGDRVMTTSSSPGIALMQEGITYCAGAELPCVLVNMMRGGPGLGSILPAQSDYTQVTRGGGNGDYRVMVLAPSTVQELAEHMVLAFEKADEYNNPVMVAADGVIAQMMEPVDLGSLKPKPRVKKRWAVDGQYANGRERNVITSFRLTGEEMETHNARLLKKYQAMAKNEARAEVFNLEDAEIVLTAYGTSFRLCQSVAQSLREKGIKVGLIRPVTLWPFPKAAYAAIPSSCRFILDVEMNYGQMVPDVMLATNGRFPVYHFGRNGGVVTTEEELLDEVKRLLEGKVGNEYGI